MKFIILVFLIILFFSLLGIVKYLANFQEKLRFATGFNQILFNKQVKNDDILKQEITFKNLGLSVVDYLLEVIKNMCNFCNQFMYELDLFMIDIYVNLSVYVEYKKSKNVDVKFIDTMRAIGSFIKDWFQGKLDWFYKSLIGDYVEIIKKDLIEEYKTNENNNFFKEFTFIIKARVKEELEEDKRIQDSILFMLYSVLVILSLVVVEGIIRYVTVNYLSITTIPGLLELFDYQLVDYPKFLDKISLLLFLVLFFSGKKLEILSPINKIKYLFAIAYLYIEFVTQFIVLCIRISLLIKNALFLIKNVLLIIYYKLMIILKEKRN